MFWKVLEHSRIEIAFVFRPIRGREICYTTGRQAGRPAEYGLYSEVALAKNYAIDTVSTNENYTIDTVPTYKN